MIWTSQKPWHGLGIEMDPAAGAIEWMKAANLDWDVIKTPMFTTLPNGQVVNINGARGGEFSVLLRDHGNNEFTSEDIFGPVGPEWVPVQNSAVFEFLHRFCEAGSMQMETCGALKGGTEIWALLKFADTFEILKDDPMTGYLLFHSAHVWGKGNQLKLTPIRVVCNNTLSMALSGRDKNTFRMPHTVEFDQTVQAKAAEALGLAGEQMDEFKDNVVFLASKRATDEAVREFVTELYQPKLLKVDAGDEPLQTNWTPTTEGVYDSIHLAPGATLQSSKGNWWGALNGVTYFEDHMRISFQDDSNTLASAWFGGGAKRKEQAMVLATRYAEAA